MAVKTDVYKMDAKDSMVARFCLHGDSFLHDSHLNKQKKLKKSFFHDFHSTISQK